MTTEYDHDLFIGCGSGGIRATRIAGGYGAKVAVADDLAVGLGGTCVMLMCLKNYLCTGRYMDIMEKPSWFWIQCRSQQ